MKSMTGFAEGRYNGDTFSMFLSMKSLNHRYRELVFKGSGISHQFEKWIKEIFKDKIIRGKIEITFDFFEFNPSKWDMQFNERLLEEILKKLHKLKQRYSGEVSLSLDSLLRFPMIFHLDYHYDNLDSKRNKAVKKLIEMVFIKFLQNRLVEGDLILNDLISSNQEIDGIIKIVAKGAVKIEKESFSDYKKKISRFLKQYDIDEKRIAQEAAIVAEKNCIVEELNRLRLHNHRFLQLSKNRKINTQGRELDFLCQEMLRETHTIASKVDSMDLHDRVLLIRREIEKMRQQVQNVE